MSTVTNQIERKPVFVAARNMFEAIALASAKFERATQSPDGYRSSLNHHTTGKPVWKCCKLANGEIIAGVHK